DGRRSLAETPLRSAPCVLRTARACLSEDGGPPGRSSPRPPRLKPCRLRTGPPRLEPAEVLRRRTSSSERASGGHTPGLPSATALHPSHVLPPGKPRQTDARTHLSDQQCRSVALPSGTGPLVHRSECSAVV